MADNYFDRYGDAVAHAKRTVDRLGVSVLVKRNDLGWVVSVSGSPLLTKSSQSNATPREAIVENLNSQKLPSASNRSIINASSEQVRSKNVGVGRINRAKPRFSSSPTRRWHKGVQRDQLIALKLFYLGRGVAQSPRKALAIDLIKQELAGDQASNIVSDRPVFFNLLLAEIYRQSPDALSFRQRAKDAERSSNIFDFYMKIVDATQKKSEVDKLTGVTIADGNIQVKRGKGEDGTFGPSSDTAFVALGLIFDDLTSEQSAYLYELTLTDIIEAENIGDDTLA